MTNSHIEHKYSMEVPPAARPIMEEMSKYAAQVQKNVENNDLSAILPLIPIVKNLMKKMLPLLTDTVQHEMYEYLLIPWITKLEIDANNGLMSKHLMDVYYAFKNAILKVGREYDDVPDAL